jgi:hypothetical protein
MPNLKTITIRYIDDTYIEKGLEVIKDVSVFNFFGPVVIFEFANASTFVVRDLTKIDHYIIKGQPVVNSTKVKSKKK